MKEKKSVHKSKIYGTEKTMVKHLHWPDQLLLVTR